jgi:hypothetical protein
VIVLVWVASELMHEDLRAGHESERFELGQDVESEGPSIEKPPCHVGGAIALPLPV